MGLMSLHVIAANLYRVTFNLPNLPFITMYGFTGSKLMTVTGFLAKGTSIAIENLFGGSRIRLFLFTLAK